MVKLSTGSSVARSLEQGTFLPFLYHTRSILQAHHDVRRHIRTRHTSDEIRSSSGQRRSYPSDLQASSQRASPFVRLRGETRRGRDRVAKLDQMLPFGNAEDVTNHERVNDVSSITGTEARIFQDLLAMKKKKSMPSTASETSTSPDLSTVVGEAIRLELPSSETLQLAQEYSDRQKSLNSNKTASIDQQDKAGGELRRLKQLMNDAPTDLRLWQIMHEQVIDKVVALELDDASKDQTTTAASRDLLLKTFQPAVVLYHTTMRRQFSTSPYALALLPQVRSLPSATFAFAAGTALYREHISTLLRQRFDLQEIMSLLAEMEENFVSFDGATFDILDKVCHMAHRIAGFPNEESSKLFWQTDSMQTDLSQLKQWSDRVKAAVEREVLESRQQASDIPY